MKILIANIAWIDNGWTGLDNQTLSGHKYVKDGGIAHESLNFKFDGEWNTEDFVFGFFQSTHPPKLEDEYDNILFFYSNKKIVGVYGDLEYGEYHPNNMPSEMIFFNLKARKNLSFKLEHYIDFDFENFLPEDKSRIGQIGFNYIKNENAIKIIDAIVEKNIDLKSKCDAIKKSLAQKTLSKALQERIQKFSQKQGLQTQNPREHKKYFQIYPSTHMSFKNTGGVHYEVIYDSSNNLCIDLHLEPWHMLSDVSIKELFRKLSIANNGKYDLIDWQMKSLGIKSFRKKIKHEEIEIELEQIMGTFNEIISQHYKNELEVSKMKSLKALIEKRKQIILQGPPGTGKTRLAKQIANFISNASDDSEIEQYDNIKLIQFHPSYSYEDFVRGIVAESNGDKIEYKVEDKILAEMAAQAIQDPNRSYVLIIDEINRANLSSVLGELIYALEYRDEPVESMYALKDGGKTIILPKNLYIIGTMNTADRSIGHIDYAIRRRFTFIDVFPNFRLSEISYPEIYKKVMGLFIEAPETYDEKGTGKRSACLSPEFNFNSVMLGHSYFIADEDKTKLKYQVLPLLKEYITDGILIENETSKNVILDLEKFANDINS